MRNKKLFRQAKVKRIQYHQTSFTTNVKWIGVVKKYKEEKRSKNQHQTIKKMAIQTLLLLSCFSHVRLYVTQRWQPTRLPHSWDSPGKNPGVGCHFLLQCMKVKSESEVTQSCPTLRDPMDYSPPGSSICGIFQARVLEWGAIAFFKVLVMMWQKGNPCTLLVGM